LHTYVIITEKVDYGVLQVPEGLVSDQGLALNNRNICITKTSPPEVEKAYYTQFRRDFTLFLRSRATEVVPGGCMVLTFVGVIQSNNPLPMVELLGSTLHGMVLEVTSKYELMHTPPKKTETFSTLYVSITTQFWKNGGRKIPEKKFHTESCFLGYDRRGKARQLQHVSLSTQC